MLEEIPHELPPRAGRIRSADTSIRKRTPDRINRIIMKFEKFFGSTLPVVNIRFIPRLPIPRLNFRSAVPVHTMPNPLIHQITPFVIITRRVGPAGIYFLILQIRIPFVLIRLRLNGKRFRHKTDLCIRPYSVHKIRVKYSIQNLPVINRGAVYILAIYARRAPLERRRAVTGSQQIMSPKIDFLRGKCPQFFHQFFSVFHIGIIRFIRPEKPPDSTEFTHRSGDIDINRHRESRS